MAPHVNRLSAYASQRLVSLFDMLARKYVIVYPYSCEYNFTSIGWNLFTLRALSDRYNKLAELKNDKMHMPNGESREGDNLPEDMVL